MVKTTFKTALAHQFIEDMAPCIDFSQSLDQIERIFQFSYLRAGTSSNGAWRQSLILSHPLVSSDRCDAKRIEQEAKIYLELANGYIYGIRLTGEVWRGIDRLADIAEALSVPAYNSDAFAVEEARLERMLNSAVNDPARHCGVRLFNNAPFAPPLSFLTSAINRITIALLHCTQEKYHPEKISILQTKIKAYFSEIVLGESVLSLFRQRLNQTTTALLERLSQHQRHAFVCLNGYNYLRAGDELLHRNRCQAIRELPWLFPFLARPNLTEWKFSALADPGDPEIFKQTPAPTGRLAAWHLAIGATIDQGQPLFLQLAEVFSVPRETIKGTRQQMLNTNQILTIHEVDLVLQLLSFLAPEKRPRSRSDWGKFEAVIEALLKLIAPFITAIDLPEEVSSHRLNMIGLLKNPAVMHFIASSLDQLQSMKLDLPLAKRWCESTLSPAADFLSALHSAFDAQQLPSPDDCPVSVEDARCLMLRYLSSIPLSEIVRTSAAWHVRILVEAADLVVLRGVEEIAEWPLVLAQAFLTSDCVITELHNESALVHEGQLMQHCVGTYASSCLRGSSVIFSVTDLRNRPRSTLELKIEASRNDVVESSHFGFRNSQPGACELAAAKALLEYLNTSALADAVRERGQFQRRHAARHREVTGRCNQRQKDYVLMTQRVALACFCAAAGKAATYPGLLTERGRKIN